MRGMTITVAAVLLVFAFAPVKGRAAAPWRSIEPGMYVEVQADPFRHDLKAEEVDIRPKSDRVRCEWIVPWAGVEDDGRATRVLGVSAGIVPYASVRDEEKNDVSILSIAAGRWVELDGEVDDSGGIRIDRVKVLDEEQTEIEIEGPIAALDPDTHEMLVAGISVRVSRDTKVRGGGVDEGSALVIAKAVDDDDLRPGTWRLFDGRVVIGGAVQADYDPEVNLDLNLDRHQDIARSRWSTELEIDARLSRSFHAFAKGSAVRQIYHKDEEGDEVDKTRKTLSQAYLVWQPARNPWFGLQVGRQDFDEPREWLYDENLDALRLYAMLGRFRTEGSYSKRWDTQSKYLRDWENWILYSSTEVMREWEVAGYVIHRRKNEGDLRHRPAWFGVRSDGRIRSGWKHWIDLSVLRGDLDGQDTRAYAVDVGLKVRIHRPSRFTVTGGFAYGSGGEDPAVRYRQTGFQDNNDKFGGVSSFKYYGELFEPELTNLRIYTAGFGFRPSRSSSLDFIYHRYSQIHPDPDLGRSNLETRPLGVSGDIGREWDVVAAFEEIPGVDIEYVFSVFYPGEAFAESADPGRIHRLQVEYNF